MKADRRGQAEEVKNVSGMNISPDLQVRLRRNNGFNNKNELKAEASVKLGSPLFHKYDHHQPGALKSSVTSDGLSVNTKTEAALLPILLESVGVGLGCHLCSNQ